MLSPEDTEKFLQFGLNFTPAEAAKGVKSLLASCHLVGVGGAAGWAAHAAKNFGLPTYAPATVSAKVSAILVAAGTGYVVTAGACKLIKFVILDHFLANKTYAASIRALTPAKRDRLRSEVAKLIALSKAIDEACTDARRCA